MTARWDAFAGAALPVITFALLATAVLRRGGQRYERVEREGGSAFLSQRAMHLGYAWIDRVADALAGAGIGADAVSWFSLALGAIAGALAAAGWLGCAAWVLAFSGVCDGIDGAVARRSGRPGECGAVLDSALDRYVEFLFYAGLIVHLRDHWKLQLIALAALFGGFMVTYSTAKAEALQIPPPRGWMKRAERLVWLIGGAAFAAAAPLVAVPSTPVIASVLAVIAVFANLSAGLRLRALARAAEHKSQSRAD